MKINSVEDVKKVEMRGERMDLLFGVMAGLVYRTCPDKFEHLVAYIYGDETAYEKAVDEIVELPTYLRS